MATDVVNRIAKIGRQICMLYGQLAREFFEKNIKMWKATPKFHIFLHLCEWQILDLGGLNPRSYWCYADEDLVGTLVEIAESCHVSTIAVTGMMKWMLLVFNDE